jgi:hypothetical protein
MKFNGVNWVTVGNPGFSDGIVTYTELAFNSAGEPYVAYSDRSDFSDKATVMKFDGTNWLCVGSPRFSAGVAQYLSLIFSPSGSPFLSYQDWGYSYKATVKKFDGTNWENVGIAGFSEGEARYTCLAFSPSGKLSMAFTDYANSSKASVLKYDSVYVGYAEQNGQRFALSPNPASTLVTIGINNFLSNMTCLEIFDSKGIKMFESQTHEKNFLLNIQDYPPGLYIVKLKTAYSVIVERQLKY